MPPMQVKYKALSDRTIPPRRAHEDDAGTDLGLPRGIRVPVGGTVTADLEIAVAVPKGCGGFVLPRSSTGFKYDCSLSNTVGVIDSGYRGSIKIKIRNNGDKPAVFERGQYLVQMIILPIITTSWAEVEALDATARDTAGFGSSGL
ncbi:hypothetical protein CFL01nite_12490 [Corynebacterium flavescens]|uniref:dUTP diphosphatase n=2 Tax=Corynebacterium flavescens TaxID=28028 RepID=A0AB73B7V2_CORFL|nr:hypothetical protein CFL01nite_12490 [Corynebacterium flavescens]